MKYLISAFLFTLAFTVGASAQKRKPKPAPSPAPKVQPAAPKPAENSSSGECTGANGLTNAEIAVILEEHNQTRKALGLSMLVWDCSLATLAQTWATRGIFEHRTDRSYGENLFVSSSGAVMAASAMENWEKEKEFWNNNSASCASGKVCTHYTQMVWARTAHIGCGINRNAIGKWKTLMVCNYDPTGNTGGRAY